MELLLVCMARAGGEVAEGAGVEGALAGVGAGPWLVLVRLIGSCRRLLAGLLNDNTSGSSLNLSFGYRLRKADQDLIG